MKVDTSILIIIFFIKDRKELKSSKQDKDNHEKKELTEKEKEREEKKKRWRKESPKKSHKGMFNIPATPVKLCDKSYDTGASLGKYIR